VLALIFGTANRYQYFEYFPVKVDKIAAEGNTQVMVRLLAKNIPLLARVTRKSAI